MKVLYVGESWAVQETHVKGFDSVQLCKSVVDWADIAFDAFRSGGIEVEYMQSHIAHYRFPEDVASLQQYDAVILSDVGSNTFLLDPIMMSQSVKKPNRLKVIAEYVKQGGGLIMFGGWLSFAGIENKARYAATPLADVLPVKMLNYDDRMEHPEGVTPRILLKNHPVLTGIGNGEWPYFLGYNKIKAKAEAQEIAVIEDGDTFMAGMEYGKGRSFAFASDCVWHWGSAEFLNWKGYKTLLSNIVKWVAGKI